MGSEIRFCDGKSVEDGLEISLKKKSDLKERPNNALYIILEPLSSESFQSATRERHAIVRGVLNPTYAKAMAGNKCSVELCLSPLFGSSGLKRVRAIKDIKTNLKYARKYSVPIVASTGATSIHDLRTPYQVFELLKVLGLTDEEAVDATCTNPLGVIRFGKAILEKRLVSEDVIVI